MTDTTRRWLFLASAAVVAAVLGRGLDHMPTVGRAVSDAASASVALATVGRSTSNVVSSVNFDLRSLDTMGEESILLAAAVATVVLLRVLRGEADQVPPRDTLPAPSNAVQATCAFMIPVAVVVGTALVAHGHVSPGGGFQGGVVVASVLVLLFLGTHVVVERRRPKDWLEVGEAAGAAGFVVLGLVGLAYGAFLLNWLPTGQIGSIVSAGTVPLLNLVVGVAVASGISLVLFEFVHQAFMVRRRG